MVYRNGLLSSRKSGWIITKFTTFPQQLSIGKSFICWTLIAVDDTFIAPDKVLFFFNQKVAIVFLLLHGNIQGRSFNVVIGVLQGALLIPFTFPLLQPFKLFSLDGNTLFKSRNPSILFRYTLKTLVNCTTKCTSGFITTTRKGFL